MEFFSRHQAVIFGGISTDSKVYGDLFMVDLDELYIQSPFTANERPPPRYGHQSVVMDGECGNMLILGGLSQHYCTMNPFKLEPLECLEDVQW